jgi:CBS-domain-containing membrane protein
MTTSTLVRDVMRPPVVVPRGMWFRGLVRALRDRGAELLLVVDAGGRVVGVVTEEDLLLKLARRWIEERSDLPESASRRTERRKAAAVTAGELMSEPVVSTSPADRAVDAARLMRLRRVRHLAVLDPNGWPLGVVERDDLLGLILRNDSEIAQDVEDVLALDLRRDTGPIRVRACDGVVELRFTRAPDAALEAMVARVRDIEGVLAVRVVETDVDEELDK